MTKQVDKIRLFALIEPLNIRMSLCFPCDSLISDIHYFIDDVMRRYTIKYKVGRVEWNGAWILPQYKISDFLEDKSEITVYSVEFGLTLKNLSGERDRIHIQYSVFDQDINMKFINKKTVKDKFKKNHLKTEKNTEITNEQVEDDQYTNALGMETTNIHDLNLEKAREKSHPPKEVHQAQQINQKKSETSIKPPQTQSNINKNISSLSQKRKGDDLVNESLKKKLKRESYSDSQSESENHVDKKHHKQVEKKISHNEDSSGGEESDIQYPQRTNQPLEKKHIDRKGK